MGLFITMVTVELFCKMVRDRLNCDKEKVVDIEDQDPASLVGTFKRYK